MEHAIDKIAPLLEKLAQQLGVTVQYLWQVLLKQATVEAQLNLMWCRWLGIFCGLIWAVIIFCAFKAVSDDDDYWAPVIVLGLISIIPAIIWGCCYNDYLTCTMNPEYFALHKVLEVLK